MWIAASCILRSSSGPTSSARSICWNHAEKIKSAGMCKSPQMKSTAVWAPPERLPNNLPLSQQSLRRKQASADLLVRSYCHTHDSGNHYTLLQQLWSYQFPEKLIPLLISNAMADMPLPIYGDGLNVRDWIMSAITVRRSIPFCTREGGEVYNVGARQELPNLQVVRSVLKR